MRKPKALSLSDIRFNSGRPYICIGVALDNSLSLEVKTFWGIPQRRIGGICVQTGSRGQRKIRPHIRGEFEQHQEFVTDLGLAVSKQYGDNHHRVFYFSKNNLKLFGGIVRGQDVLRYLKLIGVQNPEEVIMKNLELNAEADRVEYGFRRF